MSQLQVLDATGARVITDIVNALERRGITVLIKGIQERHLALVTRVGVLESLRHHKHLFADLPPAVEHARSHVARARAARTAEHPAHDKAPEAGQDPVLDRAAGATPGSTTVR